MAKGNVKFYNIPGISREDTPYFATDIERQYAFLAHQVGSMVQSYYPPKYRDIIKIDLTDITFDSAANYLSIEFGTMYYYFIDRLEYVNENLVNVYITMDVIQTYFFYILFRSGIIERKFINRWTNTADGIINRGYIRENLSNSQFIHSQDYADNDGADTGCLIVRFTTKKDFIPGAAKVKVGDSQYILSSGIGIIPINDTILSTGEFTIRSYYYNDDDPERHYREPETRNIYDIIQAASVKENVFSITYCKYWPFSNDSDTFELNGNVIEYNFSNVVAFDTTHPYLYIIHPENYPYIIRIYNDGYDLPFRVNTSAGVKFESKYVPAMLDINYYMVEYGELSAMATFELQYLTSPYINVYRWTDVGVTNRFYYLTSRNDLKYTVGWNPTVAANPVNLELITSYWNEWRSRNVGTMFTAGVSTLAEFISFGAGSARAVASAQNYNSIKNAFEADKLKDVLASRMTNKNKDRYYAGYIEDYKLREQGLEDAGYSKPPLGTPLVSTVAAGMNSFFTPNSLKQSSDYASNVFLDNLQVLFRSYKVMDFENVAEYYHHNGYLVNEAFHIEYDASLPLKSFPLFNYVNTRQYFNVLKLSEVDLVLTKDNNVATIALITDRLTKGIRLWNDINTIGFYYYDNVEKEYING